MMYGDVDPQYIQDPTTPVLWPPAGWVDKYYVTSGERWIDIAGAYGVGGWDLIEFNFGTRDEKVYNHCMKKLLGCTHTTDDRKRYNFHLADPGAIYIPPPGWKASVNVSLSLEEQAVKDDVLKVLGESALNSIRFQNPWLDKITPVMLSNVASLIRRNKIRIKVDPDADMNEYEPGPNVLTLADADTSYQIIKSTIVHECVHAAQDAERRITYTVNAECDAYIAQMIYLARKLWVKSPPVPKPRIEPGDTPEVKATKQGQISRANKEQAVYDVAFEIAVKVNRTNDQPTGGATQTGSDYYDRNPLWDWMAMVPREDYDLLARAIQAVPGYGKSLEFAKFDGI